MDGLKETKRDGVCGAPKAMPPSSVFRNEGLPRLFREIEQAFRQQALHQMRAQGIEEMYPGITPLLLHLGDEDGLTISELAKRCHLDSSTMTPLVDELERLRLVSRARASDDRRIIRLYLTRRGRSLEPSLRALLLDLQETALSGIPESDLETLRRVLGLIIANLRPPPME